MNYNICATVDRKTLTVLHKVMEDEKCTRSQALDHISSYYQKRCTDKHELDEVTEHVIQKLGWNKYPPKPTYSSKKKKLIRK